MLMRRPLRMVLLLLLTAGCQQPGPLGDASPLFGPAIEEKNPVWFPEGGCSYSQVFEHVLSVLNDYGFEIMESNRYDGRIETIPRVSPGLLQWFKPGSPDCYDRLLSTTQSYRHRLSLTIQEADNGGYFIEVVARKELEDVARPIRSTAGAAIFRTDNNIDRQFEVIDPTIFEMTWVYRGRDTALEQEIIRRLKRCL